MQHHRVPVALVEHRKAPGAEPLVGVPQAQFTPLLVVYPDLPVRVRCRHRHVEHGTDGYIVVVDTESGDPEVVHRILGQPEAEHDVHDTGGGGDQHDEDDDCEKSPAQTATAAAPPLRRPQTGGTSRSRRRHRRAALLRYCEAGGRNLHVHRMESKLLRHVSALKCLATTVQQFTDETRLDAHSTLDFG